MLKNSLRQLGSAVVLSSIWFSTAALPVGISAQTKTDSKQESAKNDKNKKQTDKNAKKAETAQATTKALSDKENPSLIGKRNINAGTDKFFGWLGGSKEKEAAIGRQMSMEIEQQAKLVDDPVVTEYINRVGQNIVLHSDAKVPFTIKVIDSDEVNAFALPGGYFYVNKGLILAADNEAELAGVMSHEIAHVAARHAMENQGKSAAINYGLLATVIFGGAIASTVAQNAGGFGEMLAFFKFSRGAEEEADRLGVQYLYASGYDPTSMSTMFEKLESLNKKKPGKIAKLFTSHPQPVDRRQSSLALVSRFPEREEYVMNTSEFQRIKSKLFKISNAKASTTIDFDGDSTTPGKPTLKRRTPEATDSTQPSDSTKQPTTTNDAPPQLKRRNTEPAPTPTATPQN